ncbi:MAG TPA: hypothetical protein VHL85_09090 [Burkholderiales bacterium]|jgi:hypothetical protein|nr:hypothetical protein [Burkholderiales bacterium]
MKRIVATSLLLLAFGSASSAFAQPAYSGTSTAADVRTADSALWGVGG